MIASLEAKGRPRLFCVARLNFFLFFPSSTFSCICRRLSVVVAAHFSPRTIQLHTLTHTHTHGPSILAHSSNKTTLVQPLAQQSRRSDRFDVRLDTRCKHTQTGASRTDWNHNSAYYHHYYYCYCFNGVTSPVHSFAVLCKE